MRRPSIIKDGRILARWTYSLLVPLDAARTLGSTEVAVLSKNESLWGIEVHDQLNAWNGLKWDGSLRYTHEAS